MRVSDEDNNYKCLMIITMSDEVITIRVSDEGNNYESV